MKINGVELLKEGTRVRVSNTYCNASDSNRKNGFDIMGVCELPDDDILNSIFEIGDMYETYKYSSSPEVSGAYLLKLNGDALGFVYDIYLEVIDE